MTQKYETRIRPTTVAVLSLLAMCYFINGTSISLANPFARYLDYFCAF